MKALTSDFFLLFLVAGGAEVVSKDLTALNPSVTEAEWFTGS